MPAIFGYVFSANFFFMWIRVATPIILVALGAVVCERSGVVNLGLEGTMLIAALFGVLGSHFGKGLLPGFLLGTGSALMISMIFAFFHLVLKANNVLCGTAINTLASGLTVFVLQMITGEKGISVDQPTMPDLQGATVRQALEVLVARGIVPTLSGDGVVVEKQKPLPGEKWPEDKKCRLWLAYRPE